mgnify:CR=1 FL=1
MIETLIAAATAAAGVKSAFGGGGGGGETTTQSVDPAMMRIYNDVYNTGRTLANQPYIPYTGARVAGFNPDQLQGFNATRNMFGQSMGYDPRSALNNLANMSAPSILDRDIGAYQNPYTQQVIDTTLADLDRFKHKQVPLVLVRLVVQDKELLKQKPTERLPTKQLVPLLAYDKVVLIELHH